MFEAKKANIQTKQKLSNVNCDVANKKIIPVQKVTHIEQSNGFQFNNEASGFCIFINFLKYWRFIEFTKPEQSIMKQIIVVIRSSLSIIVF